MNDLPSLDNLPELPKAEYAPMLIVTESGWWAVVTPLQDEPPTWTRIGDLPPDYRMLWPGVE